MKKNDKPTNAKKNSKTLTKAEIEVINKSIIDQLKEQANTLDSILIAGAGAASGSSK